MAFASAHTRAEYGDIVAFSDALFVHGDACETPIKGATSSVTDQPFRGGGGGMKIESASEAQWSEGGKKEKGGRT